MKWITHSLNYKHLKALLTGAFFFFISSSLSFALGLGGMQLHSTLNQKLNASIELLDLQEAEIPNININLASDAVYQRMGIEINPLLQNLEFSLQKNDKGFTYIQVSSREPITEPFLNFLLELNWSSGRLLREFTVLLDPPVLTDEKPEAIVAPEADVPSSFTVTTAASSDIADTVDISKPETPEENLISDEVSAEPESVDSETAVDSEEILEETSP